jgi:hypothetical protein
MWFRSFLTSWKSDRSRSRARCPRWTGRSSRLFLEQLEDRILLTSYSATNAPAKQTSYSAATVPALIADINAANQRGGTNIIMLTAPISSPYVLTAVDNSQYGATGLPVIGGGKKGDNLTIVGNGDTIERSINGAQMRLLAVASNSSLTLKNMTLTGGSTTVDWAIGGGAICNQGTLVLDAVKVTGNEIMGISGIGNSYTGDVISPNQDAVGGGVWSSGSLTVKDGTVFTDNVAMGSTDRSSSGWTFDFPSVAMGGAIYIAGGNATISSANITGNEAVAQDYLLATVGGGGIYIAAGNATISNTTITGNEASVSYSYLTTPWAGGIYVAGGDVTISNTTITGNEAVVPLGSYTITGGGGIYVSGGDVTVSNTTITGNEADAPLGDFNTTAGGGIYIAGGIVYIDAATVANTNNNISTAGGPADIYGSYILNP